MITEDYIIPNGKYKGCKLNVVPDAYLIENYKNLNDPLLREWIEDNKVKKSYLKTTWKKTMIMPCFKNSFSSEKEANKELRRIYEKSKIKTKKKPIRAYQCEHCLCWHLTSQEKKSF